MTMNCVKNVAALQTNRTDVQGGGGGYTVYRDVLKNRQVCHLDKYDIQTCEP